MELSVIQKIAVFALPVLFAITLHEAAHGYVARHFGDLTAYAAGRVSLNPLRHIDLVGTIIVPLVSLLVADILFGWAKPVPVNFSNLRRPKQDMLWVAAAGPLSNLAMALGWAFAYKIGIGLAPGNPAEDVTEADFDLARVRRRLRDLRQRDFHGAEPAAAAAARRRAHYGEPAAASSGLAVRES